MSPVIRVSTIRYPESDGRPMGEADLHREAMFRHIELLKHHFAGQQVYVSGDLLVYYEQGNPKKFVVPDTFVVKGLSSRPRRIYKIWVEGRSLDAVIETTSRKPRGGDSSTLPSRRGVRPIRPLCTFWGGIPMRLSLLAALTVMLLGPIRGMADEQRSGLERKISSHVVAAVEKELARLKVQEKEEREKTGLGTPAPSGEVAYLLLQGLGAKSTLIAKPSVEEIKSFNLERQGGAVFRLYKVNEDCRLIEEDHWKIDKVGSYHFHAWYLRVRKDGEWGYGGSGESTGPHKK